MKNSTAGDTDSKRMKELHDKMAERIKNIDES